MKIIDQRTTDPYFNLALEEYLLRQCEGDFFMLWRNSPCIVVGGTKTPWPKSLRLCEGARNPGGAAANRRRCGVSRLWKHQLHLHSGGRHDHFSDYALYCRPVIEVLQSLGVPAELSGRNDLLIEGKKFSGNAQCAYHGRMMHHGCIMFNANVNNLADALRVNPLKIQSKGIKSVRSRVTNIAEHLPAPLTMEEFSIRVLDKIEQENPAASGIPSPPRRSKR